VGIYRGVNLRKHIDASVRAQNGGGRAMTVCCAYCGRGGRLPEYEATADGLVTGTVVPHKSCASAWKDVRDLGLPTSTASGAMSHRNTATLGQKSNRE
jgi:hypothetical protein